VTTSLAWAPSASAQTSAPAPSASAAEETPTPETGSIEITATDTAGDTLAGATFLLLDSTGQEAGQEETDTQGRAVISDLATGVYRLKETTSGSTLHDVVADQDVIVTPGAVTRLTITDPFKAANLLVRAKDGTTGKPLPGATVNIGTGTSTLITLTTRADGTASGDLPVTSRTTQVWVRETKAPHGYHPDPQTKTVTAVPGTSVTVTLTHTKTTTEPTNTTTHPPTSAPVASSGTATGGADEDAPDEAGPSTPDASPASSVAPADSAAPEAVRGSLAHTGADAIPWLIGGAAVLILAGAGALVVTARRRRAGNSAGEGPTES